MNDAGGGHDSKLLRVAAVAVFSLAILHLLWCIGDYSKCFQEYERLLNWAETVLLHGKSLSLADLGNAFYCGGMDDTSRPRFVSYLFQIAAFKIRLALWDWLPPHPSFSPVWLFSLILAPWIFYRFLVMELSNRSAALLGTGIYLASAGYLSGATMLFHPAKPLSNVALIVTLYAAARARRSAPLPGDGLCAENPRLTPASIVFVTCVFPVFLFIDETAFFCLAAFPLYAGRFFVPRRLTSANVRTCALNAGIYSIAPLLFLLTVLFIVPALRRHLLHKSFDFISYFGLFDAAGKSDLPHILQHLTTLFTAVLAPWNLLGLRIPVAESMIHRPGLLALYGLALGCLIIAVLRRRGFRGPLRRACAIMALFLPFQIYLIAHHGQMLAVTGYYYGSLFSIIFALFIACAAAGLSGHRRGRLIGAGVALYVTVIQMINFSALNASWSLHNNIKAMWWLNHGIYNPFFAYADLSEIVKLYSQPIYNGPMYVHDIPEKFRTGRFAWTWGLWKNRDGGYRTYLGKRPLALADLWALSELYYRRTKGKIDKKDYTPLFESAAAPPLAPKMAMVYAATLSRVRWGKTDEERPPALAYRYIPENYAGDTEFDSKIAYPWMVRGFCDGVQWLSGWRYTHLLLPVSPEGPHYSAYWSFNDSFYAAVLNSETEKCRVRKAGLLRLMNQPAVLFEIVP